MRHFAVRAAFALGVLVAAAGCGNRNGSLVGYQPEGIANSGFLAVQVDTAGGTDGASAIVFLPPPSNRIRIYDDVNQKGYLPTDGLVAPVRTLSTGWSVYRSPISPYDPLASHVLLVRGSRDGAENALSPVTNTAVIPVGPAAGLVAGRDTLPLFPRAPVINSDAAPSIHADSLYFNVAAVSAAQTIFLEIVKSNVTLYIARFDRQPDLSFARSIEYENLPPGLGQTYSWHVDEYDSGERLVAATSVNGSFVVTPPKVNGAPVVWPSTPDHFLFRAWTIPGFVATRRTPR